MNFAIVINTYIRTNDNKRDFFDHPTPLNDFENKNTLHKTIDSINKLNVGKNDNISVYIFAVAAHEDVSKDGIIIEKIEKIMEGFKYNFYIYTNTDIQCCKEKYNSLFFSSKGYPEIRNQGFIFPIMNGEDVIIQIDDDELLRENYILKTKELLEKNPDKYVFTAPYEKNGTIRITGEDKLKTWKKTTSMDIDIVRFMKSPKPQESIFGFGGNMIIRKEFAEKMYYPLDVPRGEDFSLLLASRLIYENGNEYAEIKEKNPIFKSYFIYDKDITIIHEPPYEANDDFLFYVEKNLKRFILEWLMIKGQSNFKFNDLKKYSYYLYEMIGYDDYISKIYEILEELKEFYPKESIENLKKELISFYNKNYSENRFEKFKKLQKEYISLINRIKV
ncbi:hypothetical protein [Marinitoga sp. 1138]|uniref:hypothetical protein n=1 Tax=Marinitoga sp. 1138 TaxID=1643334 RepID=UPI0015865714|nr:hypothetical protein [Marinitoga sp. 1138]NUU98527.1 hypothetical protein [Marinitoga sp. 1138]